MSFEEPHTVEDINQPGDGLIERNKEKFVQQIRAEEEADAIVRRIVGGIYEKYLKGVSSKIGNPEWLDAFQEARRERVRELGDSLTELSWGGASKLLEYLGLKARLPYALGEDFSSSSTLVPRSKKTDTPQTNFAFLAIDDGVVSVGAVREFLTHDQAEEMDRMIDKFAEEAQKCIEGQVAKMRKNGREDMDAEKFRTEYGYELKPFMWNSLDYKTAKGRE